MVMATMYDGLEGLLTSPPFWVIVIVVAVLAYFSKGFKLAIGSAIGLILIVALDQWENAMSTLALVLLASAIALLIAIPTGIGAAKSKRASAVIRPILDFLQTMPAMVYLIPALMLFRIGVVPGMVATIIFSLAPGVRLTELGIRNVDKEVVEAGYAFCAPLRAVCSGRFSYRWLCPASWPESIRSSCFRCPWWLSLEWWAQADSGPMWSPA